jgi:hypothetical protein
VKSGIPAVPFDRNPPRARCTRRDRRGRIRRKASGDLAGLASRSGRPGVTRSANPGLVDRAGNEEPCSQTHQGRHVVRSFTRDERALFTKDERGATTHRLQILADFGQVGTRPEASPGHRQGRCRSPSPMPGPRRRFPCTRTARGPIPSRCATGRVAVEHRPSASKLLPPFHPYIDIAGAISIAWATRAIVANASMTCSP